MSSLKSIAEQTWGQLFPKGSDEPAVDREDFFATAKGEFAYQMWRQIMEEKARTGEAEIPSYLLSAEELEVVDNIMDISSLNILRDVNEEQWLQSIGGINSGCRYVKTTFNHYRALKDDDSLADTDRLFYPLGKKIYFPDGTHKSKVEIIFAKSSDDIDEDVEVGDAIGGLVRRSLVEIYGGKVGKPDETNNDNSNS